MYRVTARNAIPTASITANTTYVAARREIILVRFVGNLTFVLRGCTTHADNPASEADDTNELLEILLCFIKFGDVFFYRRINVFVDVHE